MEGSRLEAMRYIGMDVHREFAQLAAVEDGLVRDVGSQGVDDLILGVLAGNSDAIANQ